MHNAIASQFINVGIVSHTDKRGLFKEGWSAKLSFKTYNQLKAQGIMS